MECFSNNKTEIGCCVPTWIRLLMFCIQKTLLQNISQIENLTENEIIYYREHWNQAYLKVKQAETYFKIKKEMENDGLWQWLYLNEIKFEDESPKQDVFVRETKKNTQQELILEKKYIN